MHPEKNNNGCHIPSDYNNLIDPLNAPLIEQALAGAIEYIRGGGESSSRYCSGGFGNLDTLIRMADAGDLIASVNYGSSPIELAHALRMHMARLAFDQMFNKQKSISRAK